MNVFVWIGVSAQGKGKGDQQTQSSVTFVSCLFKGTVDTTGNYSDRAVESCW